MIAFVDPVTFEPLSTKDDALISASGKRFSIVGGVPRFCSLDNYTSSFGRQWNLFGKTQIDGIGLAANISAVRFFGETEWSAESLAGLDILEVGSGAGRFSQVVLSQTSANLYSIDYSAAVEANLRNNAAFAGERLHLAQASVYEMPFADNRFDKIFCLGVLQHTPDFERSVQALVSKAKPGGEIVVDFYPIRGWWTKLHAKYLLRPVTRRMKHVTLLRLIERNAGWLIRFSDMLHGVRLGALTRFLPLVDQRTLPPLTEAGRLEWSVLDTFDMFSPEHDHPQRIENVARMFKRAGATVEFAGFVDTGIGEAAVVRARKLSA